MARDMPQPLQDSMCSDGSFIACAENLCQWFDAQESASAEKAKHVQLRPAQCFAEAGPSGAVLHAWRCPGVQQRGDGADMPQLTRREKRRGLVDDSKCSWVGTSGDENRDGARVSALSRHVERV